jgi:hypothetical protein
VNRPMTKYTCRVLAVGRDMRSIHFAAIPDIVATIEEQGYGEVSNTLCRPGEYRLWVSGLYDVEEIAAWIASLAGPEPGEGGE